MGLLMERTRQRLTREEIADAALSLADEAGLDALSMRALADRLGVGTMTLYGYFQNKDELLDALVDSAVSDTEPPTLAGDWLQQLREVVRYGRRGLLRHPSIVELRVRRPVLRPEALRFGEALLSILRAAGFSVGEATAAFRLLFTYTVGFAALSPAESTAADRRAAGEALDRLPPDEFPALTEARDEASLAMGGEEVFEYGLDRILDGLEARLRAQR
jgi:AcrR family transcriptional regulator